MTEYEDKLKERKKLEIVYIGIKELDMCLIRKIRKSNVKRIKVSIQKFGYDPLKPLGIVKRGDKKLVFIGNHRLIAVRELGIEFLPCVIFEDDVDIYKVAFYNNLNEDARAEWDLFDTLEFIKFLASEGLDTKEIGQKLNWKKNYVEKHFRIINDISTAVLDFCEQHQRGRVFKKSTIVHNFTENWFRSSGLFDLNEKYQMDCLKRFITDKANWNKKKLQKETSKYKQWQKFIEIARDELYNCEDLLNLIVFIEKNTYKNSAQLRRKIEDLNEEAENKLICGDATIELPELKDSSIDLAILDPPYGIEYKSNYSKYHDHITKRGMLNDTPEKSREILRKTCEILVKKLKHDAHLYFFCSWKVITDFMRIIGEYYSIKNLIIWDKGNHGSGSVEYKWGNRHELIIFAAKGNRPMSNFKQDIISIPRLSSSKMIHLTQKPVALIKELLEASAQPSDTVLDCFMGSGSTIKAVKEFGDIYYIGIELDKAMFEKALAFIEEPPQNDLQ